MLDQRRRDGLYRARRVATTAQGPEMHIDGRPVVSFCSNDYLGLANDPRVRAAAAAGLANYGVGAGAAHLVNGHSAAHHALEEELAEFVGRERALLFSTGFMANQGVITALVGRGDSLFEDRLNHASLIDGGRLSGARLRRYPHRDLGVLEGLLGRAGGERLVVTDGVFSMDGDLAPLPDLSRLCRAHGAWLMVDDAHGLGVLGRGGRGLIDHDGLSVTEVPILVGTLGKAFGTFGAFVAGSAELIEALIQLARSYVYTTALPPAVAEATRRSLRIVRTEDWRRERLAELVRRFRAAAGRMGLELMPSSTPIQPILAGSAGRALRWSAALEARGILVTAIRPPTVPDGTARLRVTFSAAHSDAHLDRLLEALGALDPEAP
ncbi:MAG: 8-amino-7-oxononanoate synthase [Gammaproteobacteria bacterium]